MKHEIEPDTSNVIFLDEFPKFIERHKTKHALGQLTLFANSNPGQLILFPERVGDLPDAAA